MADFGHPFSTISSAGYPMSSTSTMLTPYAAPSPSVSPGANLMTAGNIGTAFGAIGGIISALGAAQAAKAQKQNLKFQSEMSALNAQHAKFLGDTNAKISELGAQSILAQGQQQSASLTMRSGKLKSSQRATMAANGIDLGEGNAAEVLASTDIMNEIDKNMIEANSIRSAWGYRMQGTNAQASGDQTALNYTTASNFANTTSRAINPTGEGMSSLMSSAGSVAKSWYLSNKGA